MKTLKKVSLFAAVILFIVLLSGYFGRHWIVKKLVLATSSSNRISKDTAFVPIRANEHFHEELIETLYKNDLFMELNTRKRDTLAEQLYHFLCANRLGSWDEYSKFRWPAGLTAGPANTNHILHLLLSTLAKQPQSVPKLSGPLTAYVKNRTNSLDDQRFAWENLINFATNQTFNERMFAPGQWEQVGTSGIAITRTSPAHFPGNSNQALKDATPLSFTAGMGEGMQAVQPVDDMSVLRTRAASLSTILDIVIPIQTSRAAGRYRCGLRVGWSEEIGAWVPIAMAVDNKIEAYAYLF